HVAALICHNWTDEAERLLILLAKANKTGVNGEWGFNEWLHGESGHPMGFDQQAWSAAMYLYAHHALESGHVPLFDNLRKAKPAAAVARENNDFDIRPAGGPV